MGVLFLQGYDHIPKNVVAQYRPVSFFATDGLPLMATHLLSSGLSLGSASVFHFRALRPAI
jgi:hypothetical protein